MYLEKGDVVTEIEPEDEDGYLYVTKDGKQGQIPKSCLGLGSGSTKFIISFQHKKF